MARIAVILVLPIEYNNSSMLRCRSIMLALSALGHYIKCYCPNPDIESKYYSANNNIIHNNIEIYRYKRQPYRNTIDTNRKISVFKKIKLLLKKTALYFYHKIDVFGSTVLYISERKAVSEDISKGNFDTLLSFSDPMPAHLIANYCKKHNPDLKYIQQWGDPLASDTISKIALPVWIRKIIESYMLNLADRICYVSPLTYEEQKRLFPAYATRMIFLPTPSLGYKDKNINKDMISVGYFGSYNTSARNILPFYNAAKENPDVAFYIIGDSDLRLESTENISVINRLSPRELEKYMARINVIVCLMNRKGNQVPGKLYHYASSTKDILLIKDGEYGQAIQDFFARYDHYTFTDNTTDSIDAVIKNYLTHGIPERKPVTDFRPDRIAENLISGL